MFFTPLYPVINMDTCLLDSCDLISDLVSQIAARPRDASLIFLDLEGIKLGRNGTIAIMQILLPPNPLVYLVDIYVLKEKAFTTTNTDGMTLQAILEANDIAKCIWDVRSDSDALFSHYGINLGGVVDIQVLEYASRFVRNGYISGLAMCIRVESNSLPKFGSQQHDVKEIGKKLFAPECGGRYEVFLERPLSHEIVQYCANDVLMLPGLLSIYARRLRPNLASQIQPVVNKRIQYSQSADFKAKGKHMIKGPLLQSSR